jgi:hypothetical protein
MSQGLRVLVLARGLEGPHDLSRSASSSDFVDWFTPTTELLDLAHSPLVDIFGSRSAVPCHARCRSAAPPLSNIERTLGQERKALVR